MKTAIEEIISGIKTTIAPVMEEWKENKVKHALETKAWWKEYMKENRGVGAHIIYRELFNRVTKTEWQHISGCSESYIREYYEKEMTHKMLKINTAVVKKIKDADQIVKIECRFLGTGKDGFVEGYWTLTLKDGTEKVFGWSTLYAGGWNIQCLHVRSKYTYK